MVKKIAALAGAGAILLSVAVPVFAVYGHHHGSSDVAIIRNSATANANTGENVQGNMAIVGGRGVDDVTVRGDNWMSTGDATAYAGALVVANTHIGCGRCGGGGRGHTDLALVGNSAVANANTGWNFQGNYAGPSVNGASAEGHGNHGHGDSDVTVGGDNTMRTGGADSTARAWVIVNTHWGGI